MAKIKSYEMETLSLHAGQRPDPATGARATPIYQTASYVFKDTDHAASIFNIERTGHVYSRISNPTNAVLEERISALEGGVGAIATASGQAAMHLAIATLMGAGSHIVSSQSLYGGTHNLLAYTLPRFGIETTFVDPRDPEAFRQAMISAESALEATQAGFEVGTRTIVDVLIAEQRKYQAQRDNSIARHAYILRHLQLKAVAGLLKPEDLQVVNQLLQ